MRERPIAFIPRTEIDRLQRYPLLIVDEVGYIPFDPQAFARSLRASSTG
jgi:hypothetical protein